MAKKVYKARKGAHFNDDDAQIIGERIDYLISKLGLSNIRADEILDDATKKSSPLHRFFDWDDASAAHKQRLQRANRLLANTVVVVTYQDGEKGEERAFVNLRENIEEPSRVFVTLERALSEPEMRKQMLKNAIEEIEYWEQRYKSLKKLTPIFKAIKVVTKK